MAEAAVLSIIGWILSPIIKQLVEKGIPFFKDGFKGKLENLASNTLPQIKFVIEKTESLVGDQEHPLVVWMRELQDAAYEVENVIDEYEYELLKRQAKGKSAAALTVSYPLTFRSNASFRSKLRDSLEKLDKIASRVNTFTTMFGLNAYNNDANNNSPGATAYTSGSRVTGSELTEVRIFGRDTERDHIVDLLINREASASDHRGDVLVLPIVGDGGVGKTTLAQYVYNDPKIIDHFPRMMWIDMPQHFDEGKITRMMVESAHQDCCQIKNYATLQQKLKQHIQGERFLLVLDDVWYDEKQSDFVNKERWRKLLAPLSHGKHGSVVLITCRADLVAKTFSTTQPIRLKGLEEHDCESLFDSYAFGAAYDHQQRPHDQHLMEIGKKIVRKIVTRLGGLPLAAKVLGGMLRDKRDAEEWEKVLRTNIWEDITRVLTLSYKSLPPLLQQCVAHRGLYHKGMPCDGAYLVYFWIAQGFMSAHQDKQTSGKTIEDIGRECLKELEFRSFYQRTHDGLFKLHDLMYDVAENVSRHECASISRGEKIVIPITTRHLHIPVEMLDEYKENICQLKNLRSLLLCCNSKSFILDHGVLEAILIKSKRLHALDLAACCIDKLPDSICGLKHLRFLDLSRSNVKTLPKSFSTLHHLLYLDLSKCKLDSVPKDMSELINLRHLKADGGTLAMIPNIGRLTELQELKEFHVKKEKGHGLEQLKNLVKLRGTLQIGNLENVSTTSEANEAKLNDKSQLKQVWLGWGGRTHEMDFTRTCNSDLEEMVLDGFQPPPNITHLGIKWYGGSRAPVWMQPNCFRGAALQTLVLDHCVLLQSLPPIAQLFPHLREIVLKCCDQIRYLPRLPPTLVRLMLSNCKRLVFLTEPELQISDALQLSAMFENNMQLWESGSIKESLSQNESEIVEVDKITRRLRELSDDYDSSKPLMQNIDTLVRSLKMLSITEKVNKMPLDGTVQQLPSSLQRLELYGSSVDDTTLSECLGRLSSLTRADLVLCVCILSLPSGEVLRQLRRLQELNIKGCLMLASLGGLAELPSLEKLEIRDCPNLMRVLPADDDHEASGALLPESLTHLDILNCGLLDTHLARCLTGLTRLSHLSLVKCEHVKSFPTANDLRQDLTSLECLHLQACDQLVSLGGLPVLAPSLRSVDVYECPGLALTRASSVAAAEDGLSSLVRLTLDNLSLLPSLLSGKSRASLAELGLMSSSQDTLFTQEQEECLQQLISLKKLRLENCERLPSLPRSLKSLTCLEYLGMLNCPQVRSLQSLPMSLEFVTLENCHPELEQSCQEGGRDWDLIKNIPNIRIIRPCMFCHAPNPQWIRVQDNTAPL